MSIHVELVGFYGFNGNKLQGEFFISESLPIVGSILFCHGICSSRKEFGDLPLRLAERGFAILTFDYSGHGDSAGIQGLFTKESHQDDTKAALDYLVSRQDAPAGIFGHSFGVYAALKAGIDNPEVKFIVLYAPQIESGGSLPFYGKLAFRFLGSLYGCYSKLLPDFYIYYPKSSIKPKKLNTRFFGYAIKANNCALASKVNIPTLVVAGEIDRHVSISTVKRVYDAIPAEKEFIILKNSGHSPFFLSGIESLADGIASFCKYHLSV